MAKTESLTIPSFRMCSNSALYTGGGGVSQKTVEQTESNEAEHKLTK